MKGQGWGSLFEEFIPKPVEKSATIVARLADRNTCPTINSGGSPFAAGNRLSARRVNGRAFGKTQLVGV